MFIKVKLLIVLILSFGLMGCVFTPAHPKLSPTIVYNLPKEANKGVVAINAVDARESTVVGLRGKEGMSAPILINEDLAPMLKENFKLMAQDHGYSDSLSNNVTTNKRIIAKLLVLNNNLVATSTKAFFKTDIAIEVQAYNKGKTFTHIYRYSQERATFWGETEAQTQENLNNGLSDLLSKIAADNNLWDFLLK